MTPWGFRHYATFSTRKNPTFFKKCFFFIWGKSGLFPRLIEHKGHRFLKNLQFLSPRYSADFRRSRLDLNFKMMNFQLR